VIIYLICITLQIRNHVAQSGKSPGKMIVLCASICQFWKMDIGWGGG